MLNYIDCYINHADTPETRASARRYKAFKEATGFIEILNNESYKHVEICNYVRTNTTLKLILSGELAKIIPYSQNHLRRLEAAGDFPKRDRIGANQIAWLKDEIENCIAERVSSREGVSL